MRHQSYALCCGVRARLLFVPRSQRGAKLRRPRQTSLQRGLLFRSVSMMHFIRSFFSVPCCVCSSFFKTKFPTHSNFAGGCHVCCYGPSRCACKCAASFPDISLLNFPPCKTSLLQGCEHTPCAHRRLNLASSTGRRSERRRGDSR